MTHSSNLVALCLPEGEKVISKWTVTTVHCQWTGIKPDSQNFIWISWKQILVFLPFTEAQNYIFYVENHLTECNGSFYRRIFYKSRLISLTLENSCMDRSCEKRANLELNKSSGKLLCFRIRIPRIGYYNTSGAPNENIVKRSIVKRVLVFKRWTWAYFYPL